MKKLTLLSIALLMGVSVWADDVINVSVYDDCRKNGYINGVENGHEYIDLGLPSGIKWASCNVGAETPEGNGNYYAWGEVVTKKDYSWSTYKYANGSSNTLTKYCNDSTFGNNGFKDNKTTLDLEDDAAHVNWGGAWRMPTSAEFDELLDSCTWTWTTQNNVNGYLVTSKTNSNSLFLPAAGYTDGRYIYDKGLVNQRFSYDCEGIYRTASLYYNNAYAESFGFGISERSSVLGFPPTDRYKGCQVRSVYQCSSNTASLDNVVILTLYADGCEKANVIKGKKELQVNVTAVSKENRHFVKWSDGNTDNPRLVTVTIDTTLTAEFADDPYLTLLFDGKGTVSGAGCFKPDTSCKISASADFGYHFTQWSDGNTDNPRLVTITKDTTFTAEFAQNFSGQCGDSLYWSYAGHTLTISGTGAMYKYYITTVPWLLFRDTTTEVILERGITYIGTWAFNDFVKLNKIELPNTLTSIGASAFAGCLKLLEVYSYAVNPPVAENNSIFANYNVYLYVPCDNLFDYQTDVIFGSFKYIQCIGAENTTTTNAVTVTSSDNEAVFVWPADGSADTYNLQISKDGAVFCTLIFNANGQLSSIAFAPSHDRQKHRTAEQTSNGFRFTVTGLSESTHYTFDMAVKDATDATLQTYTGEFNTTSSSTAVDNTFIDSTPTKVLRDGQVLILRGNKTYTVTGVEVK